MFGNKLIRNSQNNMIQCIVFLKDNINLIDIIDKNNALDEVRRNSTLL